MPCDHVGGPELIEMAEEHLRKRQLPENAWTGMRFRYTENLTGGMWASVVTEIERRGEEWVVTRLDRRREPAPAAEEGFKAL